MPSSRFPDSPAVAEDVETEAPTCNAPLPCELLSDVFFMFKALLPSAVSEVPAVTVPIDGAKGTPEKVVPPSPHAALFFFRCGRSDSLREVDRS